MADYAKHPSALHHYVSLAESPERFDWFKSLVVDGRAYLKSPLDFNDPFDCAPVLSTPKTRVAWDILGRRYRECLRADFDSTTADNMWASYKKHSDAKKAELLLGASRMSAAETGVFWLAEVNDSVLMWSHYADNHRAQW